jgi:putative transposase
LLKFGIDRDGYVDLLFQTRKHYRIDILNYIVTSNHVHLLVWSRNSNNIGLAMQFLHGRFAQFYNHRKAREGAFWRDRYHTTAIESGFHLSRCLFYIDMNMVRAGVVDHPSQWKQSGYHELAGRLKRYLIINKNRLLSCLMMDRVRDGFTSWYERTLAENLESTYQDRVACWTEAHAVGNEPWLKGVYQKLGFKNKKIRPLHISTNLDVNESPATYYIEG